MDGISVYLARKEMGMHLADAIRLQLGPKGTNELKDIDAVFAVPETSCNAAMYCAQNLGIQYSNGLVRNQFISRTFIMPAQAQRMSSVKHKFTAVKSEFADRNVLIIDDSIVRGTTSRQVVQIARKAGARKVFLASSSPAIRYVVSIL